jgi:hypothetical protein
VFHFALARRFLIRFIASSPETDPIFPDSKAARRFSASLYQDFSMRVSLDNESDNGKYQYFSSRLLTLAYSGI